MQRYTVYFTGNCSTCFGWYHHPSSGAQTTISMASGICHTATDRAKFTDIVYVKIILKLELLMNNVYSAENAICSVE